MNRIGFLGSGQMATALAKGFVSAGIVSEDRLFAFDPEPAARANFSRQFAAVRFENNNAEVVKKADCIFLAVKPQNMTAVLNEVKTVASPDKLFVSIAAGVSLAKICEMLGTQRAIRVMPNTPSLVGEGAAGYALASGVEPGDGAFVGRLLSAVGKAFELDEKLLDAVTGLSGSGPAFIYMMIEALSDGGVRAGLPRPIATTLAAQTVLGSAKMVLAGDHPGLLKDRVTSPGGTTIEGISVLEDRGVRGALIAAVDAAARKSRELGKN